MPVNAVVVSPFTDRPAGELGVVARPPEVLWPGVYRSEGAGLDCRRRGQDSIHRTRITVGE